MRPTRPLHWKYSDCHLDYNRLKHRNKSSALKYSTLVQPLNAKDIVGRSSIEGITCALGVLVPGPVMGLKASVTGRVVTRDD